MNESYTFPAQVVQAIVSNLGEMPAIRVRALLNAIESLCAEQDQQRKDKEAEEARARIVAELKGQGDGRG